MIERMNRDLADLESPYRAFTEPHGDARIEGPDSFYLIADAKKLMLAICEARDAVDVELILKFQASQPEE